MGDDGSIDPRPATADDFEAVATLFRGVLPNADYTVTHPVFRKVEEAFVEWKLDSGQGGDMHSFFEDPKDRVLYVVERSGHIVAMSGVIMGEGPHAELVRMQVLPEHQGQGIGQVLLHKCETWAREMGAVNMVLDTWVINETAQGFYERSGYKKSRVIKFEFAERFETLGLDKVNGLSIDDLKSWEMTKALE